MHSSNGTHTATVELGEQQVPVGEIRVRERTRTVKTVDQLQDSMHRLGLLQPIIVNKDLTLITGAHRLQRARNLGWITIRREVVDAASLEAEIMQIDENLMQHPLSALEQGEHMLRRKEVLTKLGIEWRRGNPNFDRTERVKFSQIASEIGLTDRAVQYRVQAARDIVDDVRDMIRDTPVADRTTDLLALARMEPTDQREIALMIREGRARNVAERLRPRFQEDGDHEAEDAEDVATDYDADVTERLNPLRIERLVKYKVANPRMRARGDKFYPREDMDIERPFTFQFNGDVFERGEEGLKEVSVALARHFFQTMRTQGWPVPGKTAHVV